MRSRPAPLRIGHVVPRIAEEASGPSYSVPQMCDALGAAGASVELHVLAPVPARAVASTSYRVRGHPGDAWLRRLGGSRSMRCALRAAAGELHILHNHSLWLLPNVYPAQAVAGTRCRLVVSPRGTLSPWALRRSRGRKRLFWMLAQRRLVRVAAAFHATSDLEYREIRAAGGTQPVAIIPNGVTVPVLRDRRPRDVRRLLFLGRLHPKKGVDLLLDAWAQVADRHPGWELVIAGPDEDGYGRRMAARAAAQALPRVHFVGPRYGDAKADLYAAASLFVLPTHSENFGLAVAEALAHGVPAIVSTGAPWSGLAQQGCGWWIEVAWLADTLDEAMGIGAGALRAMGLRGRIWMEREFAWGPVGERMLATYDWLVHGGVPPPCVRLD